MELKKLFTSESVSEGHPDKLCDAISDAILDECLKQDKSSRVACECYATTNHIIIGGEITTKAKVDYRKVARDVIKEIGYDNVRYGLDYKTCKIDVYVKTQSLDIALGVNKQGAGDQGMMFGYATNETKGYMPLPIVIAHKLVRIATQKRKEGSFKWARPDMKSQVTIDYTNPNKPKIQSILMSVQHDPSFKKREFKNYIYNEIMIPVVKSFNMNTNFKHYINPTGKFVIGGPKGDVGLTGRKIIVDTYGGSSRHGGGAFSGKDCTKVDRSGAYMARYIAKNVVAAGLASRCEVQLAYIIGKADPASVMVDTFNTNKIPEKLILEAILENFKLQPAEIISHLNLTDPQFKALASYGHFGRNDIHVRWEDLDKVEDLKKYLSKA
ncbi:MAG: methionine adenosyltransferase [Erysipelotrichaceae bacterium]|nr:methionine adenosyltransferase [Erysipelotrichaceae bacterium]